MSSAGFLWLILVVALLTGCAREAEPASPLPPTPFRVAGGDDEIRRLLLDAATSGILCEQLENRFLPLPDQSAPVALQAPAAGWWWIRRCQASSVGPEFAIQLAGPARTWVEIPASTETLGFGVHQYLSFDMSASMQGVLEIAYERSSGVATIWLSPTRPSIATLAPRGRINAAPETGLA